ncbi:MAG: transposase [Bacteroidales bacterium]|nr:transposase [Bacteroidales bacterium]MCM1147980.1 transposase [Bacteroidales bacterium]MCM1206904.1 transposase [Bacillota bacterium]MCM1509537.1 transposase [Clostridium sp.]
MKFYKLRISMTQAGDLLHNAMAERMDNTVKSSLLFSNGGLDFIAACGSVNNATRMCNTARPHQALGMKTPYEMMTGCSNNPLMGFRMKKDEESAVMNEGIHGKIRTFAPPRNRRCGGWRLFSYRTPVTTVSGMTERAVRRFGDSFFMWCQPL